MKNWKSFLAPVLVFVLGAVCGGGGVALYAIRELRAVVVTEPGEGARRSTQAIMRNLHLDAEQRAAAQPIFDRIARELTQARVGAMPQVRATIEQGARDLRPLLHPGQQRRLDQMLRRSQARWNRFAPEPIAPPDTPAAQP
jgi:hypothetical protein